MSGRKPSILPSDYYPDYFKLDLGIGGPAAHPIAAALDEMLFQFSVLSHQQAYSLHPRFFDIDQQKRVLTLYGFVYEALGSSEITELFDLMPRLFETRGSLLALECLARLYFGNISVMRGRPTKRDRLTEGQAFPIEAIEPSDSQRCVFVQLSHHATVERAGEFRQNARLLIPSGFAVTVANPREAFPPPSAFMDLSGPVRLQKRRL